jgi:hypothetical protein
LPALHQRSLLTASRTFTGGNRAFRFDLLPPVTLATGKGSNAA